MKVTSLILALTATAAAAPEIQKSQRSPGEPLEIPPPTMRKDAQRKYYKFGPYTLKANPNPTSGDGGHSHAPAKGGMGGMGGMMGEGDAQSFMLSFTGSQLCTTCTVLSGQIKLTYADGSYANTDTGVYVHHILTNAAGRQPGFVGGMMGSLGGAGFVGAGDDNGNTPFLYAPKDGSVESGFWIQPTTTMTAQIVLVNYKNVKQEVYLNYDLEFLKGNVGKKVKSSLISAAGIGSPKTSRSGPVNTTSSAMPFTESGAIILAKGHLHDGGNAMYMDIRRGGSSIFKCSSRATYGKPPAGGSVPTIVDMNNCNEQPIKIQNGDSMVMTAEYDLKAHPLRSTTGGGEGGTMGMFRIIFAPDKSW